jgi:glycine oxidase ThiO
MRGAGELSGEVIVVGGGVIGLAIAAELAERGVSVTLISERRPGEASPAAAGMLAPSVERASGAAHDFAIAARDRYPSYVDFLAGQTGRKSQLTRIGNLQLQLSDKDIKGHKKTALPTSRWIDARELKDLEPALSHGLGAIISPDDGAVDNTILLAALERFCANSPRITRVSAAVVAVDPARDSCRVKTESDAAFTARRVVIAAGAWAARISGAQFAHAITPARGQLVSYSASPLRHVAYGPRGYVVPRGDLTIGGTTMENVGFDSNTTTAGLRKVRAASEEICPDLAFAPKAGAWAGLRPVTPDMLPILGPDPEHPSLLYACGHSRNGVLMAPLTGDLPISTESPLSRLVTISRRPLLM